MFGIIEGINNRVGGFIVVNKLDNGLEAKLPSGSKILCTNCTINNQSILILNGDILKTLYGFEILRENNITIIKNNVPLTILCGREILYTDSVKKKISRFRITI